MNKLLLNEIANAFKVKLPNKDGSEYTLEKRKHCIKYFGVLIDDTISWHYHICYATALCRVQNNDQNEYNLYSRGRLDRFSRNAQVTNWIEVTKTNLVCQKELIFDIFFLTEILQ